MTRAVARIVLLDRGHGPNLVLDNFQELGLRHVRRDVAKEDLLGAMAILPKGSGAAMAIIPSGLHPLVGLGCSTLLAQLAHD